MFQDFYYNDDDNEELERQIPRTSQKVSAREEEPKTKTQENQKAPRPPSSVSTRVNNAEIEPKGRNSCAGVEPKAVAEPSQKSRTGRTVKPFTKALKATRHARIHTSNQNPPPIPQRNADVEKLVVPLTTLLSNWDKDASILATQTENQLEEPDSDQAENPLVLLATRLSSANAGDLDQFVCSTQFDMKEPETYTRAMQSAHATWARAIEEELDQLHKNKTWILVPKEEIEPGHRPLEGK